MNWFESCVRCRRNENPRSSENILETFHWNSFCATQEISHKLIRCSSAWLDILLKYWMKMMLRYFQRYSVSSEALIVLHYFYFCVGVFVNFCKGLWRTAISFKIEIRHQKILKAWKHFKFLVLKVKFVCVLPALEPY